MPEHPELRRQRGTVLGGTLVLSIVMTMAAGSFLLATGFINSDQQETYDNRKLMIAGESLTLMAVRYMRDVPPTTLYGGGSIANDVYYDITPNYPLYDTLQDATVRTRMGNPWIRACYVKLADTVRVLTWAVMPGAAQDTLHTSWKITSSVAGGPWGMSILTLKDWKDTLLGYY